MKNTREIGTSYLQEFGCLLVTDATLTIIGVGESVNEITGMPAVELLGKPLNELLEHLFPQGFEDVLHILRELQNNKIPRQVVPKHINDKSYYIKFSTHQSLLYIEWEEQLLSHISAYQLNELGFLFDSSFQVNDWIYICRVINRQLNFSHVFILQIHETGQSKVIAEQSADNIPFFDKKEYSRGFISDELISDYERLSYRYIADFRHVQQPFYSVGEIDLKSSQLFPPSNLHRLYWKDMGIYSALFFPLCLDGKLWGMLCAVNHGKKKIDLQTRKLCTFIVQSFMSRFENLVKQKILDRNQKILQIETRLKRHIVHTKTVNCTMVQHMDVLADMCNSDGVAIYNQGDTFFHGVCPNTDQFYDIIEHLKHLNTKKIFKDYNFKLTHGAKFIGELPFAGLLSLAITQDNDYYIVWFRKERITTEIQVEIDTDKNDRTTERIKVSHNTIFNTANRWEDDEIHFVYALDRIITESLLSKTKERDALNEELRSMNNELEMFTFSISHDLRNPLSVLKMGIQFLSKTNHFLTADKRLECYSNLQGSISNIEGIIDNIVTLSQSKTTAITKDPIPMAYTIRKISQDATLLYKSDGCTFHFGKLYPLWGEKSALYQVFLNLIGNAVKYSCARSRPEVWIESNISKTEVSYCIKDNGIGIPKETLPNIFDMFTRAPNAYTFQGSGIGLSLVKRIMERLGGSIEVKSVENKGTEFTLYFPVVSDFPPSMLP